MTAKFFPNFALRAMRQLYLLPLSFTLLAAKPVWKPLFDGVSFKKDWHTVGDSAFWTVDAKDSAIVGYSPDTKTPHSLLFTNDATFDQFTVKYSYRLKAGCSGFWFRTRGTTPDNVEGPQVEVKREGDQLLEIGSIYVWPTPGWTVQHSQPWSVKTAPDKDGYQRVVLTVKQPYVYVNVNGVQAIGETNSAALAGGAKPAWDYSAAIYMQKPGSFALQVHKDYAIDVRFKDIAILTGCGDRTSPLYPGDYVEGLPLQPAVYQNGGTCETSTRPAGRQGKLAGYLSGPRGGSLEVAYPGAHTLELADVDGRIVFSASAPGPMAYALKSVKPGVYLARLDAGGETAARRILVP